MRCFDCEEKEAVKECSLCGNIFCEECFPVSDVAGEKLCYPCWEHLAEINKLPKEWM